MKYKLKFIIDKKEVTKEYEIPKLNIDNDMQTSLDLLGIQAKAERHFKDLFTDDKESPEYIHYRNLIAMQFNLDITYYILHKIDKSVTFEMVNTLGKQISKLVDYMFDKDEKKEDFQEATKKQVANLPQKKP